MWTSGQFAGSAVYDAIEAHLAACPSCGVDLDISHGLCDWVTSAMEDPGIDAAPAGRFPPIPRDHELRVEAARLMAGPASSWLDALDRHPSRQDPSFLFHLADRVLYLADESPSEILAVVPLLRRRVDLVRDDATAPQLEGIAPLLALALGVAHRTTGDHAAALEAYAEGEIFIDERPTSREYARLLLARAESCRALHRLDDARWALQMARQVFGRLTDARGEAKALWQLAHVEWQAGDAREAFLLARSAHDRFRRLDDEEQLPQVLQVVALALIGLGRLRPAERLLLRLLDDDRIASRPVEVARVRWKLGEVRALRGEIDEGLGMIEAASDAFLAAGSIRAAASALLDVAHFAGRAGKVPRQTTAAAGALRLLEGMAATEVEAAIGAAELGEALRTGLRLAEALASARNLFRV